MKAENGQEMIKLNKMIAASLGYLWDGCCAHPDECQVDGDQIEMDYQWCKKHKNLWQKHSRTTTVTSRFATHNKSRQSEYIRKKL